MPDVTKLHDDEVDIDASLVTCLLAEQFPAWAGLPVRVVASSGTDNVTFRVGPDLAVRLPRTARMQGQVEKDLAWLPRLAPKLPLAVPEPLAVGAPAEEYPFSWGVYRWLEGTALQRDELDDLSAVARDLAEFVHCLQQIDTTGAPTPPDDPFSRGTPLAPRDELFRAAVEELRDDFDTGARARRVGGVARGRPVGRPPTVDPRRPHARQPAGRRRASGRGHRFRHRLGGRPRRRPAGRVVRVPRRLAARLPRRAESRRARLVRARGWTLSLSMMALAVLPRERSRGGRSGPALHRRASGRFHR